MLRRHIALVLLPAILSGCSWFQNLPPEKRRAIIVSFDGGGQQVMDHFVADGVMPNLQALRADGVEAAYSRTNYPSKTAAGHAALWTGGFADTNGITSNHVLKLPLLGRTLLDTDDGFDSRELLSEPIWVTAARAGRRAIVLQATHVAPLSTYEPGGRFGAPHAGSMTLMDGYSGVLAKEAVYHGPVSAWPTAEGSQPGGGAVPARAMQLTGGGVSFWAIAYDDPRDPTRGYDTVALAPANGGKPYAVLKPVAGQWSAPVTLETPKGSGHCNFHLFALGADGGDFLLYRTPVVLEAANKPLARETYYDSWPFMPQGATAVYAHGDFGRTLMQGGGDGLAEQRYLETVDFFLDEAIARTKVLLARQDWDLAVSYIPFPDEALHMWYGFVDANSPSYDAGLAPRVWKLLDRVGADCDRYVGTVRGSRDTVVAIASDHGFAGLKYKFYVNAVLRKAGLLAVTRDGRVDLAHTQAFYPDTDGAFIVVNSTRHKGGIVPVKRIPLVLDKVQAALAAVKAEDGTPLVTSFVRPGNNDVLPPIPVSGSAGVYDELGVGGIRGGDLYFDLHPGYNYSPDWRKTKFFAPYGPGQGGHVFDPRRADMHAALTIAGPGVKRGVKIGPVRNVDLAPTITHLLGVPMPQRATGRVLVEALTEKTP